MGMGADAGNVHGANDAMDCSGHGANASMGMAWHGGMELMLAVAWVCNGEWS